MYAKEMPIVSISTCRIFLLRLQDKISFFPFNFFFISSLGY